MESSLSLLISLSAFHGLAFSSLWTIGSRRKEFHISLTMFRALPLLVNVMRCLTGASFSPAADFIAAYLSGTVHLVSAQR